MSGNRTALTSTSTAPTGEPSNSNVRSIIKKGARPYAKRTWKRSRCRKEAASAMRLPLLLLLLLLLPPRVLAIMMEDDMAEFTEAAEFT